MKEFPVMKSNDSWTNWRTDWNVWRAAWDAFQAHWKNTIDHHMKKIAALQQVDFLGLEANFASEIIMDLNEAMRLYAIHKTAYRRYLEYEPESNQEIEGRKTWEQVDSNWDEIMTTVTANLQKCCKFFVDRFQQQANISDLILEIESLKDKAATSLTGSYYVSETRLGQGLFGKDSIPVVTRRNIEIKPR